MGSLRFLGNPHALMPCSLTPAGPTCQAIAARRHGPCGADGKGSHKAVFFRGSIAGPRRSLSTLRSRGCPRTTQDSLPVAGQALPDGIGYPQDSTARFPGCFLHHFPLSQACPDAAARQPTGPHLRLAVVDRSQAIAYKSMTLAVHCGSFGGHWGRLASDILQFARARATLFVALSYRWLGCRRMPTPTTSN
jgi:hypothetical protein